MQFDEHLFIEGEFWTQKRLFLKLGDGYNCLMFNPYFID